jgi:hypothetical protein
MKRCCVLRKLWTKHLDSSMKRSVEQQHHFLLCGRVCVYVCEKEQFIFVCGNHCKLECEEKSNWFLLLFLFSVFESFENREDWNKKFLIKEKNIHLPEKFNS